MVGVVGSVCSSVQWWVRVRWGLVLFLHRVVSMVSKSVGSVMLLCFVSDLSALSWLVRSVLSLVCFLLR